MIKWAPSYVALANHQTKRATLEFSNGYGGAAYLINCVGHFDIGRSTKNVKHGIVYLSYPLTADASGPYNCTWQATLDFGPSEKVTATLSIRLKR